jgi:hypothetical protein
LARLDNDSFMKNRTLTLSNPGKPDAGVVNDGPGFVGLVAPNVVNKGTIEAKLGPVHLASGDTATVDMFGDGLMEVAVSDDVKSQFALHSGTIEANGGKVAITEAAGKEIVNSLVLVQGTLKAQSVGIEDRRDRHLA